MVRKLGPLPVMPEVAGVRDRRAFLIFVGMQVAAWSVPASAMPIHSANAGEPRLFVRRMEGDKSGSERSDFNDALAVGRALDLTMLDSHAVRDGYAQAEAESRPWLFNHVVRSWLYGAKLTQHRALFPDAELVAVAVLLHDLGLARGGAPDRRFEVLGADAGRAFALSHTIGGPPPQTLFAPLAPHPT